MSSQVASTSSSHFSWRSDRYFWLIFGIACVFGLIYNFAILPGFGPDEPRHFNYVKLLVSEHRLPFLLPDGSEYAAAHSLHPPLYYVLLIPFYLVGNLFPDGAVWHIMRLGSLACCLGALFFVYEIAEKVTQSRAATRFTTAILALLPIFGMTSGTVTNDSISIFAVAFFLWLLLVKFADDRSPRAAIWIGLCFGLGMLCKATVAISDLAALAVFFALRKEYRSLQSWRFLAIIMATAALVAAPWYIRNFMLYGKFSPIESGYSNPALPDPSNGVLVMMMHSNFPYLLMMANWGIFYSIWSQKDWIPEPLRNPVYFVLAAMLVIALIGHIWQNAQKYFSKPHPLPVESQTARITCYIAFAGIWFACLWMAMFVHWGWAEGGRYLIAGVLGLALFIASGWQALPGQRIVRFALPIWILAMISLNSVTIYWLLSYLNPTFGST